MLISIENQLFPRWILLQDVSGFLLLAHSTQSWKPVFTDFSSLIQVIFSQHGGYNEMMPASKWCQHLCLQRGPCTAQRQKLWKAMRKSWRTGRFCFTYGTPGSPVYSMIPFESESSGESVRLWFHGSVSVDSYCISFIFYFIWAGCLQWWCYWTGAWPWVGLPRPGHVCWFLTSCRKDFTTRVQVFMWVRLLNLGTVKQGRA